MSSFTDATGETRLRVLHVITGLAAGGAEDQLRLILPRLREHGVASEVVAFYNTGSVARALRADGIAVTDLHSPGFWDRRAVSQLASLIRSGGYDLVHTHLFRAGLHGRIAARRAGMRTLVHTEHSLNPALIEGRRRNAPLDRLYRWAERRGTVTVAVSTAVADELAALGVSGDRVRVIPNGIDPRELEFDPQARSVFRAEHGLAEDDFVVLCLGRLAAPKRLDLAIESVAEIADAEASAGKRIRLLLVGAGDNRDALAALADRLLPTAAGQTPTVVFTGELPSDRLAAVLSAADMLVSPSLEETFGLSVLGAAAAGLPVAFVSCPALTEPGLSELTTPEPHGGERSRDGTPIPLLQHLSGQLTDVRQALVRAIGRVRAAGPPTEGRRADPAVAAALSGYHADAVAGSLAALYRDLTGPRHGRNAPHHDRKPEERRVGVQHV